MPKWRAKLVLALALGLIGLVGQTACVQVDGGAIELSWSLRSFTGDPIVQCTDAGIAKIQVWWQPEDESRQPDFTEFACEEARGVTGFEVPEGPTRLWVGPVCVDGAEAAKDTFQAPPPILRNVTEGDVITLNSLLIVVSDNTKDATEQCLRAGCTCVR